MQTLLTPPERTDDGSMDHSPRVFASLLKRSNCHQISLYFQGYVKCISQESWLLLNGGIMSLRKMLRFSQWSSLSSSSQKNSSILTSSERARELTLVIFFGQLFSLFFFVIAVFLWSYLGLFSILHLFGCNRIVTCKKHFVMVNSRNENDVPKTNSCMKNLCYC